MTADRLYLATMLFYLSGTVLPVLEAWLPALTLELLFHQLGGGVDNTTFLMFLVYTDENNFRMKGLGILM